MINPRLVFLFLTLLLSSIMHMRAQGSEAELQNNQGAVAVSIFEVLTNPNKFHSLDIIVTGVYRFDLDLATLYPSKEYLVEDVFSSSISLELPAGISPDKLEALMELNGQFVRVSGTFDAQNRGYSGFNKGTIVNVKEIARSSKKLN
ncbi:hypothetical protein Q4Q52_07435 [Shewanella sp. SP1S2-4]|uniref:hypothetical protein n=1 Tax=Shewanella sp. SP1S2-4 TaxID=3063537 RepID=UPI00288EFC59|nr:hypothetical protein [Shewanella sp. SP1S2-4]MDT3319592.1 hypothetical protein [Shewanella sp. SP1S2-4]